MKRHAGLLVLIACAFVLRLATLRTAVEGDAPPHGEADERVFITLVAQVREHPLAYTLQGTALLGRLDRHNYDKPIFSHPPAFVYLCAALSSVGLPLPLIPVLLDLATIVCVYLLALRLHGQREALWTAFLLATCTATWFVSQHIWIDAMVVFSVTLVMVAAERAGRKGTPAAYALAGGALALAFLSKITAVLVAPAALALVLQADRTALTLRKVGVSLLAAATPCVAWIALLRIANGEWLPSAFPTAEMMRRYPFVASIVARPWHYYLSNLALFAPVFALAFLRARARAARDLAPALCAGAFFVAMTAVGLLQGGYQTRYVAPAYPALALLAGAAVAQLPATGVVAAAGLVAYGAVGGFQYAVLWTPRFADLRTSVAEQFIGLFR